MKKQKMFRCASLVMMTVAAVLTQGVARADIVRFRKVADGVYRGGQPQTPADYERLRALGVRTIIDLRWESSQYDLEKQEASRVGMEDMHFPMNAWVYPDERSVSKILSILADRRYQPVFIHCQAGKDRTGTVMGLYRIHNMGWTADQAYDEMRSLGFNPLYIPLNAFFWQHSKPNSL